MEKITAYPFLISRNKTIDYEAIVVPDFLGTPSGCNLLIQATGQYKITTGKEATYLQIDTDEFRNITIVFRVNVASTKDINQDKEEILKDEVGRKILFVEGIVIQNAMNIGKMELLPIKNFEEAHQQVIKHYQNFWKRTQPLKSPEISEPFELIEKDSDLNNSYTLTKGFSVSKAEEKNNVPEVDKPKKYNIDLTKKTAENEVDKPNQDNIDPTTKPSENDRSPEQTVDNQKNDDQKTGTMVVYNETQSWKVARLLSPESSTFTCPDVDSVAFSPDGNYIAARHHDQAVRIWSETTKNPHIIWNSGFYHTISSVAFSPTESIVATGMRNELSQLVIKLWNWPARKEITLFHNSWPIVNLLAKLSAIAFHPKGELLVSASSDKTIKLWDIRREKEIHTFWGHSDPIKSVAISPNEEIMASADEGGVIILWNLDSKKEIDKIEAHSDCINSIVFSPDGKMLASGSNDSKIRLWDVENGNNKIKWFKTIHGVNFCKFNSVAFSPDGLSIASGSNDKYVEIWDVRTGKNIAVMKDHIKDVMSVAFNPKNSNQLVSGSKDGTIRVWEKES